MLHTVFHRTDALAVFKCRAEIGRRTVPKHFRNLADGIAVILKQIGGMIHFQIDDILFRRYGKDFLKKTDKMCRGDIAKFRQMIDVDVVFHAVLIHEIDGVPKGVVCGKMLCGDQLFRHEITKDVIENHLGFHLVSQRLLLPFVFHRLKKRDEFFQKLDLVNMRLRKEFIIVQQKKVNSLPGERDRDAPGIVVDILG